MADYEVETRIHNVQTVAMVLVPNKQRDNYQCLATGSNYQYCYI
jgi:hypothetical protein